MGQLKSYGRVSKQTCLIAFHLTELTVVSKIFLCHILIALTFIHCRPCLLLQFFLPSTPGQFFLFRGLEMEGVLQRRVEGGGGGAHAHARYNA